MVCVPFAAVLCTGAPTLAPALFGRNADARLHVKGSTLAGAGLGTFAGRDLRPGARLGERPSLPPPAGARARLSGMKLKPRLALPRP